MILLNTENLKAQLNQLHCGDRVLLSGTVYTARDAAHKKLMSLLDNNEPLPFEISGAVIYYCGPTPAPLGMAVGSAGPTTSGRMDPYSPRLFDLGLAAAIGKGERNDDVVRSIARNSAAYFCAVGGAGALASRCIIGCEVIAFPELGCESVKRLSIKDFPLTVAVDSDGVSIFSRSN